MIKKGFRFVVGLLVMFPYMVLTWVLSMVVGEEQAVKRIGPRVTAAAKRYLKRSMPRIRRGEDFQTFATKMNRTLRLWRPFYDVKIIEDNGDIFKIHVSNCPFCEVLNTFGHTRLSPYVCQGDWAFAEDHKDKWLFERQHQIGTGDRFCDHTYGRIQLRSR